MTSKKKLRLTRSFLLILLSLDLLVTLSPLEESRLIALCLSMIELLVVIWLWVEAELQADYPADGSLVVYPDGESYLMGDINLNKRRVTLNVQTPAIIEP